MHKIASTPFDCKARLYEAVHVPIETPMLKVEGPQNPAKVEEELRLVIESPGSSLQLPVRPREWWLGGEIGLTQLAITWARVTKESILVTHVAPEEDPAQQLRSMARRFFGFTALLMSHEIVDRDENLNRSLRREAYHQCRHVVEMMFKPVEQFALGSKVFLLSVDHSTKAFIPWLYTPTGAVGDRIAFMTLARELVTKTTASVGEPIPEILVSKLGAILHELFKNTDEWARTDENDVPWRRSIRGIVVERHEWSDDELAGIEKDNASLKSFLNTLRSSESARLRLLELTVFDSGIGLARRWLRDRWKADMPLNEEYHACLACLTKHRTSSAKPDKGVGLAEVMATVDKLNGFLKIRTGRLALFRDFANEPLASPTDVKLNDYFSRSEEFTSLANVFGTHYQILVPL